MTDTISIDQLEKDKNEKKGDAKSVKRDQWGRYLLAHPDTGEMMPWTRASTMARTLADNFALEKWMQRNLVFGIGKRKDLYAKAASVATTEEKDTLSEIVDEAFEAASQSSKANLGTALHRFTERVDAGEKFEVPEEWAPDIKAYSDTLKDYEIEIAKDAALQPFSERIVICPQIQTAGTFDRIVKSSLWKLPRIGDLKTGSNAERGMGEFALQLAIYANATHWWDPENVMYHKMPELDLDWALIMHVPVGTGNCTLWDVNIAAGWEAVELALGVRNWRKRKDLCAPTPHPSTRPSESDGKSITPITEPVRTATAAAKGGPLVALDNAEQPVSAPAEQFGTFPTGDVVQSPAEAERPEYAQDPEYKFEERLVWLRTRIANIIAADKGSDMAKLWGSTCPDVNTFRKGGPVNNAEVDRVAGVCALVEMAHALPFHDGDPAKEKQGINSIQELLI